jgi:CysZ protein
MSAGFSTPSIEGTAASRRGAAASGFSTPDHEDIGLSRRWTPGGGPEEDSLGATTSDYGAGGADPFFRKSPSSGTPYSGATTSSSAKPANTANTPSAGIVYLSRGLTLLTNPGLASYIALPLAVSAILFSLAVWWGMGQFGAFSSWFHGYLPFWLVWIEWLLWPFFAIAPVAVIFYVFTLLTNLIAAPFNALLAEKVVRQINGMPLGGGPGFGKALLHLPSSFRDEWRKSVWFALRALPLLVLFFIPWVNLLAPLLWALFSAWSLGLKYLDYPMGNQGIEFDEVRARAAEKRWLVLNFGGAVLLMTLVPVLNFLAMPAAVAGGAALWAERMAPQRNPGV